MNRQPNFTFEEVYNTQTDYDENEFFNQQTNEQFLEEENRSTKFSGNCLTLTTDLNSLSNKPKLPFITIPSLNLKILIDSGASNSIINPGPANKYFKDYFFKKPFVINSLNNTVRNDQNISYPLLQEYGIKERISFHVLQWHERFDALLSSHDFQKLNAKINYENQCLEINNVKIPFFIELNPLNFTPFSQRTNNHLKIPVNIENGPVVIPNLTNGKIIVPESIAI
jgi:hypothetical protein